MPGYLEHTNEVLVQLGEDYLVQCSATQAQGIIIRRQQFLDEKMESISGEIEALQARLDMTQGMLGTSEDGSNFVDIREDYHSSDSEEEEEEGKREEDRGIHIPTRPFVSQSSVEDYLKKIERLEQMEMEHKLKGQKERKTAAESTTEKMSTSAKQVRFQDEVMAAKPVSLPSREPAQPPLAPVTPPPMDVGAPAFTGAVVERASSITSVPAPSIQQRETKDTTKSGEEHDGTEQPKRVSRFKASRMK